jgi:hypothetical protein
MAGKFILKNIADFSTMELGAEIQEADFTILSTNNKLMQFGFKTDEGAKFKKTPVLPGLFTMAIVDQALSLVPTEFTSQDILDQYVEVMAVERGVEVFFNRLNIYEELKIDPKRSFLLYGPPGCGKSTVIAKVCNKYVASNDTAIVLWPTDKYEASVVKTFLNSFDYETHGIKRFFLIIEDLGGVESADAYRPSESSLLALLDNVERTFKVPTVILATTNFPEMFLENLTNRPQRFDDVIEVKPPNPEFRAALLNFFMAGAANEEAMLQIKKDKYSKLSAAHIKEIVVRSKLYDITLQNSIDLIYDKSAKAAKKFSSRRSLGIDNE